MIDLVNFHFIRPYGLWMLLPWVLIIVLFRWRKRTQGQWSSVCDDELLPFVLEQKPAGKHQSHLLLGSLASLLAILALVGPSWQRLPSPVFRNTAALVIALDLSRSMNVMDIKPSRLIRARFKIIDILKQRKMGKLHYWFMPVMPLS